ncbi:MAG TPA: LacI family DNA-binding transcriptional regulator, partial [Limnochordia bacterium]
SEKTRARVLAAAAELGFQPTRRRSRPHGLVGIVTNELGNGFTARMVQGALNALQASGARVLIAPCDLERLPEMSTTDLARWLGLHGVHGMIVVAHTVRTLAALRAGSLPTVLCYSYSERGELPSVLPDDFDGARRVMRHLTGLGHRTIALVNGPADWKACRDREDGYRAALTEVGEAVRPDLISTGGWGVEDGYRRARALLQHEAGISAIFAANDWLAIGAMDAVREGGLRVGRDVAVVGFDDREAAALVRPPLTTVRLPLEEMGETAARMLIDTLSSLSRRRSAVQGGEGYGGEVAEHDASRPHSVESESHGQAVRSAPAPPGYASAVMIPCRLVVRSSCGARLGVEKAAPS